MPLVDLTNSTFDDEIEKHALAIFDFWAPWCGPCKAFAPLFEAAARVHPDILFARINVEEEPVLAKQFEIFSVPTLIAVKNGTIVYARPGALSDHKLAALVSDLRNVF